MQLLIFAHKGESQVFIKELKATCINDNILSGSLYTFEHKIFEAGYIYICKEGIYDVMAKLPYIINSFHITRIINYGIAGLLDPSLLEKELDYGSVIPVRTSYLERDGSFEFRSFTLDGPDPDKLGHKQQSSYDCISSYKRVLSQEYAQKLTPIAQVVDRELWGIAQVAKIYKTRLYAFKLISDLAGLDTDCFDLKKRAALFSQAMFEHFENHSPTGEPTRHGPSPSDLLSTLTFDCGQYQKSRLLKLLKKLTSSDLEEFSAKFGKRISKKDASAAILFTEEKIYPFKFKILKKIDDEIRVLKNHGLSIVYDRNLEKEKLQISLDINHKKNIDNAIKGLSEFNYDRFSNIFKGKL